MSDSSAESTAKPTASTRRLNAKGSRRNRTVGKQVRMRARYLALAQKREEERD